MNSISRSTLLSLILLLSLSACINNRKREGSGKDYVYQRNGKPFGIIRVECADCKLTYTVNHKNFTVNIKDGNEDRFIFPRPSSYVKAVLHSHENQMIRILAINPNGKIVSNVLDSFKRDEQKTAAFLMECIKHKNTVVVNTLAK